jgi:hypothetical protein
MPLFLGSRSAMSKIANNTRRGSGEGVNVVVTNVETMRELSWYSAVVWK